MKNCIKIIRKYQIGLSNLKIETRYQTRGHQIWTNQIGFNLNNSQIQANLLGLINLVMIPGLLGPNNTN